MTKKRMSKVAPKGKSRKAPKKVVRVSAAKVRNVGVGKAPLQVGDVASRVFAVGLALGATLVLAAVLAQVLH